MGFSKISFNFCSAFADSLSCRIIKFFSFTHFIESHGGYLIFGIVVKDINTREKSPAFKLEYHLSISPGSHKTTNKPRLLSRGKNPKGFVINMAEHFYGLKVARATFKLQSLSDFEV